MMRLPLLALSLTLAACNQQAAQPEQEAPAETRTPVEPDGGIGDGAGPPDPAAVATDEIPARFLGVWDSGDCSAASETRVEVAPAQIEFYESVGTVMGVSPTSGGDVLVETAMKGEGMAWTDTIRFQITATRGGKALLVSPKADSDNSSSPVPKLRCPD